MDLLRDVLPARFGSFAIDLLVAFLWDKKYKSIFCLVNRNPR